MACASVLAGLLLLAQDPAATSTSATSACSTVERLAAVGDLPAARAALARVADDLLRSDRPTTADDRELLQRLGTAALDAADAAMARRLFTRLVEGMPADAATAARWHALLGLDTAILACADFGAARTALERDLGEFTTLLPPDGVELANGKVQLSRALRRIGDAAASLELARAAEAVLAQELGERHLSTLLARVNLAEALLDSGQVPAAAAIAEPTCDALAAALPDEALELGIARAILGRIELRLGAFRRAMALFEHTLATFELALPPDHVHLLQALLNVANGIPPQNPERLRLTTRSLDGFRRSLGDEHFYTQCARIAVGGTHYLAQRWGEALPHASEAVRVLTRDYPHHFLTLNGRQLLLEVLDHLGRRNELQQQREQLLADYEARFPPEHAEVQSVRVALAQAQRQRGDLTGAAITLERAVALLPDGAAPALVLTILRPLAVVRAELGDLPAALLLQERIVELLAADGASPSELRTARQEIAALRCQFDGARALDLQQQVVDELAGASTSGRGGDPTELARALANLAAMKAQTGDLPGALALQRRVVELHAKRPANDPMRLRAIGNLAETLGRSGDANGAVEHLREVVAGWQQVDGGEFEAAVARSNLAWWMAAAGTVAEALPMATAAIDAIVATGRGDDLAVPDCLRRATWIAIRGDDRKLATQLVQRWAAEVRHRLQRSSLSPRESAGWLEYHDDVVDTLASMALGCGDFPPDPALTGEFVATVECLRGGVLGQGRRRWHRLAPAVRRELDQLEDDVRAAAAEVAACSRSGIGLRTAVEASDRAQRAHAAALHRAGGTEQAGTTPGLLAALPANSGAVALRSVVPLSSRGEPAGPSLLVAAAAAAGESPQLRVLGETAQFEAMAADLERLGMRSPAWVTLREQVIDVVCELLPSANELYLAAEGSLQSVPWDALELADGRLVGDQLPVRMVTSLGELDEAPTAQAPQPAHLLACGDIDFGGTAVGERARGDRASGFGSLPATRDEIAAVVAAFASAAPSAEVETLTARTPEKARVLAAMPGCSHVHLATHGYFEPIPTGTTVGVDAATGDANAARLAPQVLCGIALAGANAAADAAGRHPGIATAEELAAVDLTACELVVLSACEGTAGIDVRGRGVASLRSALRAAGARFVVAASWRVTDDTTRTLMTDFYTRLLQQPADHRDPHTALWQARTAAKARGASFRDWAGWSVVGR